MKKWTIKELNAIDNITFAKTLLSERKDALTYYSPLAKKLSEAIAESTTPSKSIDYGRGLCQQALVDYPKP